MTRDQREEIARILEIVAQDGLPGPRDLDVALDAIECTMDIQHRVTLHFSSGWQLKVFAKITAFLAWALGGRFS